MSLTKGDLTAIKGLIDSSIDERVPRIIDERVPKIIDECVPRIIDERVPRILDERLPAIIDQRVPSLVQPMFDRLEKRLVVKLDQLTLDVGQFSLETTENFVLLNTKVDRLTEKLAITMEMTDTNRVEIKKVKRNLGMA